MILTLADRNLVIPDWSADRLAGNKFDRDAGELPRYASIEKRFGNEAVELIGQFSGGKISKQELLTKFKAQLYKAETEAFIAGKRSAGKPVYYVTPAEQRMLTGRHSRNMRYFNRFVRDVESGRGRMPYPKRARLYAQSLWSVYNRGQAGSEGDFKRYLWRVNPDIEHCKSCLERWQTSKEKGGFTWDELIEVGFPGERTLCMVNCHCFIEPTNRVQPKPVQGGRTPPPGTWASPGLASDNIEGQIDEGTNEPITISAAGVAGARVLPATVAQAAATAGQQVMDDLDDIFNAVRQPDSLTVADDDKSRTYYGNGYQVELERTIGGLWVVAAILMEDKKKREADEAKRKTEEDRNKRTLWTQV